MADRITFRTFEAADLERLALQAAQQDLRAWLSVPGRGAELAAAGPAWTGEIAGAVVGCAGFRLIWPGRATAWALIGRIPPAEWVRVTAKVRAELAAAHAAGHRRIEATVTTGFGPGCRWVRILGFEVEGIARAYDPSGNDHFLYARIEP